jgi:PAS domain S-box-containing protein
MEDGKIVISNQRAEKLFGLSRQALLGDDIFRFFEDGEELRSSIADYGRMGRDAGTREITRHIIRDFRGEKVEVDIVISVSWTDNIPMFTAILRKVGG